jgi:rhodanese-related sulfurtransferase
VPDVSGPGRQVVLICNQGYQSSLAAYTLRQLGVTNIVDVIGGFEAWLAAGLPRIDSA